MKFIKICLMVAFVFVLEGGMQTTAAQEPPPQTPSSLLLNLLGRVDNKNSFLIAACKKQGGRYNPKTLNCSTEKEPDKVEQRKQNAITAQERGKRDRFADQLRQVAEAATNKKKVIITNGLRSTGLVQDFKKYSEISETCTSLKSGQKRFNRLNCDDYHEKVKRDCQGIRGKYNKRYRDDINDVCRVADKYETQFISVFGQSNIDAIKAVLKDYERNNNVTWRSIEHDYPYTDIDVGDLRKKYTDASDGAKSAENRSRPPNVDLLAKVLQGRLKNLNHSQPSVLEAFRKLNSELQKIAGATKSANTPTLQSVLNRYRAQKDFAAMLAAPGSKRGDPLSQATRILQRQLSNVGKPKNKTSKQSKSPASPASVPVKNALAFCWPNKRKTGRWQCHGPTQLVSLYEPLEKSLRQAGCSGGHVLQRGISLRSAYNGKLYNGDLYGCPTLLKKWSIDIRTKYSGLPNYLR